MTTTSKPTIDIIRINSQPEFDSFERNVYGIVSDNVEIPVWARMLHDVIEEEILEIYHSEKRLDVLKSI